MEPESPGPPPEEMTDGDFPLPPPEPDLPAPPPETDIDNLPLPDSPPAYSPTKTETKVKEKDKIAEVGKVSLPEALNKVKSLIDHPVPDPQPSIEGASKTIHYRADFDTNFGDRNAYITGHAKFLEEATLHADLTSLLEEGQQYVVMLYTWRSCSGAYLKIHPPKDGAEELRQTFIEIMQPFATQLMNFMEFTKKAVERFGSVVKDLCRKEKQKDFVSEAYLLTLGKVINLFAELNNLLNTKSSVTNDYASYRRTLQASHVQQDIQQMQESQNLSMFLATQNGVITLLKETLKATPNYEDLLLDIVGLCMNMYEHKLYFDPQEKYKLVKGIAVCLFLIDREGCVIYKVAPKKNINLSKVDRLFKQLEAVPLYGDIQTNPYEYMKASHNFDETKWPFCESSQPSPQSDILSKMEFIRREHTTFICHLTILRTAAEERRRRKQVASSSQNTELYTCALQGLQFTSSWTQHLLEVYCWKLLHPVEDRDCPKEGAEDYEKSIRYNYNSREKSAIIEIIAMIKGLQRILDDMDPILEEAILAHIYTELQLLVEVSVKDTASRASKKKKDYLKILLNAVLDTSEDSTSTDKGSQTGPKVVKKVVRPSSTQLYMTRTMLESLITNKTYKKDIGHERLQAFQTFHRDSFSWPYMVNFSENLRKCCDLSQLWYREFFLEMTKGTRIQFPTEMSLPWILTDHILESNDKAMLEYVLYPLDLYNDSAQYALNNFRKQFLYDEIEAEVNLCFDQFAFKVSNKIFAYYKQMAAGIMITKLRRLMGKDKKTNVSPKPPGSCRYQTLMSQRHVQILGRSIDMNRLISQKMSMAVKHSIDIAISRFEAGDVSGVVELEALIQCNRVTHGLLSQHLTLMPFEDILQEVNDAVYTDVGRISKHIENELVFDFIPNYCFNSTTERFVPSILSNILKEEENLERGRVPDCSPEYVWGTKDWNKFYGTVYKPYRSFVGAQHFTCIAHMIGYGGTITVIKRLMDLVEENLKDTLPEVLNLLKAAIPEDSRLPMYDYGASAVMTKYSETLKDIIQYADLKIEVLHRFKIVGNALLFCLFIERGLMQNDISGLTHSCMFQGRIPRVYIDKKDIPEVEERTLATDKKMKAMQEKYSAFEVQSIVNKIGSPQQVQIADPGYHLTRDRLCLRQPMFTKILAQVKTYLSNEVWRGESDKDLSLNYNISKGFHHLWSAIQFFFCIPVREEEFSTDALHGEGLYWAGCALIMLLGQHERFETLDFCYHLRRVFLANAKDETVGGIQLTKMMVLIRNHKFLNDQIFAVLNNFLDTSSREDSRKTTFKEFQPPVYTANTSSVC